MTATERVDPPLRGGEADTLLGFLDYHRDTLRMKVDGLSQAQLAQTLPPSTMTLGGLVKHLALVENWWFSMVLMGNEDVEPWAPVDWDADPDWEWRTADGRQPRGAATSLRRGGGRRPTASSRRRLADGGMDALGVRPSRREGEGQFSLRWILVHMIEEYARHNGHADLIARVDRRSDRRVTDPAIRPATEDDWPRIWPIFDATVRAGETYAYPLDLTSEQARDLWLERPPGLTVVLEEGEAILGTAKMGPNRPGPRRPRRHRLVHGRRAAARGRGVGRRLGEYVVQWHRDQGYRGIQFNAVVETNESAVRLWQTLGFEIVGTVPGAFRSPHARATSACT